MPLTVISADAPEMSQEGRKGTKIRINELANGLTELILCFLRNITQLSLIACLLEFPTYHEYSYAATTKQSFSCCNSDWDPQCREGDHFGESLTPNEFEYGTIKEKSDEQFHLGNATLNL